MVGKTRRKGLIDSSLHESCLRLRTMPSLAYGGKSCSLKWKAAEMDYFLGRWVPAQQARMLGLPVLKLIGYDASPADLRRYKLKGDAKTQFAYPLRDAGLTRPDLMMIIQSAGLEQPGKSACFFCPASQPQEVRDLAILHPELTAIAIKIEAQAILRSTIEGKIKSTIGLGRRWTWRDTINSEQLEYLDTHFDTGLAARCELTARASKAS